MLKIGVYGVRGFPARYGGFDQAFERICRVAEDCSVRVLFDVFCRPAFRAIPNELKCVRRSFSFIDLGVVGIIFSFPMVFFAQYLRGCRTFLFFGYGLAMYFPILRMLNCRVVCNPDGFEWRRSKWRGWQRSLLKTCESLAGRYATSLIPDSECVRRYFRLHFKRDFPVVRYGSDISSAFAGRSTANSDFAIVVMRMEPENNIKLIVEAFASAKTDLRLELVGPETKYFNEAVLPLVKKSPRINWRGSIYCRNELLELWSGAKFYIHGHSVGGTNPTLVEAVSIKVPLLVYETTFSKEVVALDAQYWKSTQDLRDLIENFDWKPQEIELGDDYHWQTIAIRYFKILGCSSE